MIKKKDKYLKVKQYGMVFLLIAITLGFLVPGFLQGDGSEAIVNPADIKICYSDTDCYLTCDDGLKSVMCYRNICEIDSCEYAPLNEFNPIGEEFTLSITVLGEEINLPEYFATFGQGTFFMSMTDEAMQLFTPRLPLGYIFEKVGIVLQDSCISINGTQNCEDETHVITSTLNGEERSASNDLLISKGDVLTIVYE